MIPIRLFTSIFHVGAVINNDNLDAMTLAHI